MEKVEILLLIKKHLMSLLPDINEDDIQASAKMAGLGANSIDRSEVIIGVMEDLNIKVPLVSFGSAKNIGDLIDIFYQAVIQHEK